MCKLTIPFIVGAWTDFELLRRRIPWTFMLLCTELCFHKGLIKIGFGLINCDESKAWTTTTKLVITLKNGIFQQQKRNFNPQILSSTLNYFWWQSRTSSRHKLQITFKPWQVILGIILSLSCLGLSWKLSTTI